MPDNHGEVSKCRLPVIVKKGRSALIEIAITFVAVRESAVGTPGASAGGEANSAFIQERAGNLRAALEVCGE
jgi:hypothetical protein